MKVITSNERNLLATVAENDVPNYVDNQHLDKMIFEHNLVSLGGKYTNISLATITFLLGVDEANCVSGIFKAINSKTINATYDEVDAILYYGNEDDLDFDVNVRNLCLGVRELEDYLISQN